MGMGCSCNPVMGLKTRLQTSAERRKHLRRNCRCMQWRPSCLMIRRRKRQEKPKCACMCKRRCCGQDMPQATCEGYVCSSPEASPPAKNVCRFTRLTAFWAVEHCQSILGADADDDDDTEHDYTRELSQKERSFEEMNVIDSMSA
ncbi:uncharacterized protein LOC114350967 [Ostrinia furnacalis]|uniref:uncharacterized protein LOC114350967 n=1 Tax=Ostrinia furnacalis TaxID=93504 RepID=UPI00103A1DB6|nr:uncharacterized protein LOC114350967 [Ostrinia furnacalis]